MNTSVGCTTAGTLRLANFSEDKVREKIATNLACLEKIFLYNAENAIHLYRVSSNLIPFASHDAMTLNWAEEFKDTFTHLKEMAQSSKVRLSTHPGQFVLLNAPTGSIVQNSIRELEYQTAILDLLGMDCTGKVQIHVGGVYGDKEASIARFISHAALLPERVRSRLIIENDERLFTVEDCIAISSATGIPVLFDAFHHSIHPGNLSMLQAFNGARATWKEKDGTQQIDYSEQDPEKQSGAHSQSIDPNTFNLFIQEIQTPESLDVMLEVKDKEQSVMGIRDSDTSLYK